MSPAPAERSSVPERLQAVIATELCQCFGISRETGYVWLRRYRQYGMAVLLELNRAPERHPNQTTTEIEQAVLELRAAHMTWGPRKLKRVLLRDQPERVWPATSTIGEIVKFPAIHQETAAPW